MSRGDDLIFFEADIFQKALDAAIDENIKAVQKAVRSTINKISKSAKSVVVKEITEIYNVSPKVLAERIKLFGARLGSLESTLLIGGRPVSLSYFGVTQYSGRVKTTRRKKAEGFSSQRMKRRGKTQGVQVKIMKGGTPVTLKRAWLYYAASGHVAIFQRVGKEREPYRVKKAISIASMFNKSGAREAAISKLDADLERVFAHQLDYFLGQL